MARLKKGSLTRAERYGISQHDAGGAETLDAMEHTESHRGAMTTDWVPLDSLRIDPKNPRRVLRFLTRELLLQDPAALQDTGQREELEKVLSLAASIRDTGMRNPIEAYAIPGDAYMIISGERRYWASLYNLLVADEADRGLHRDVRVTIYKTRPKRIRLNQLSENWQRADLTLADLLHSVISAIEEMSPDEQQRVSARPGNLGQALHLHKDAAWAMHKALYAWPTVRDLVGAGKITSMRQLRYLFLQPDEVIRKALPKIARFGFSYDRLLDSAADAKQSKPSKPSRPVRSPTLLRTSFNLSTGQRLTELVADALNLPKLKDVDWSNEKAAKAALKAALEALSGEDTP